MTLATAERLLITRALARYDYQSAKAAAALGLSHPELQRRRLRLGI